MSVDHLKLPGSENAEQLKERDKVCEEVETSAKSHCVHDESRPCELVEVLAFRAGYVYLEARVLQPFKPGAEKDPRHNVDGHYGKNSFTGSHWISAGKTRFVLSVGFITSPLAGTLRRYPTQ